MKQTVTGGYLLVSLYAETGKKMMRVHRLVASAFLGEPEAGAVSNHRDGDKLNNVANNLEWTTVKGNTIHSYASGLQVGRKGPSHHNCKLSEDQVRQIIVKLCNGESQTQISLEYGVSRPEISLINSGVRWDHIRVEDCGSPPYFSRYPTRWNAA